MLTCPCNVLPLTPHFYIVKLRFTGVYIIFLFLLWDVDCGCTLKPLACISGPVFWAETGKFHIFDFAAVKSCCVLHGHVFVML